MEGTKLAPTTLSTKNIEHANNTLAWRKENNLVKIQCRRRATRRKWSSPPYSGLTLVQRGIILHSASTSTANIAKLISYTRRLTPMRVELYPQGLIVVQNYLNFRRCRLLVPKLLAKPASLPRYSGVQPHLFSFAAPNQNRTTSWSASIFKSPHPVYDLNITHPRSSQWYLQTTNTISRGMKECHALLSSKFASTLENLIAMASELSLLISENFQTNFLLTKRCSTLVVPLAPFQI